MIEKIFDENGNLKNKSYYEKIRKFIFDVDNGIKRDLSEKYHEYINSHKNLKLSFQSDIQKLYYYLLSEWTGPEWTGSGLFYYNNISKEFQISEKFFIENEFKIKEKSNVSPEENIFWGKSYTKNVDITVSSHIMKHVIIATKIKLLDNLWYVHIDDEDENIIRYKYICYQEDFIKFVGICGLKIVK